MATKKSTAKADEKETKKKTTAKAEAVKIKADTKKSEPKLLAEGEISFADKIRKIEVSSVEAEDLEKEARAIKVRRTNSRAIGEKLFEIYQELGKIEGISGWRESERLTDKHNILSGTRDALLAEYPDLAESAKVSFLFHLIRASEMTEDAIFEAMHQVQAVGRGKIQRSIDAKRNGRFPRNAVVFMDKCLVPSPENLQEDGRQTKTDFGIFSELRKLIQRYRNLVNKEEEKRIAELLGRDNVSDNLADFLAREPDEYRIHFVAKSDVETHKVTEEGVGIVSLEYRSGRDNEPFLTVRVVDGAGSLRFMNNLEGFWIPLGAFFRADYKADPSRLPRGIEARDVERLVRVIRAATAKLRREHAQKQAEES